MPITSVTKDAEALTMTVVSDFSVPVQRLWDAHADPRQLEKFWGPEDWPATFTRHDFHPGGRSHYWMTGPDGTRAAGYWEFLAIDPGRSFEVTDGFADESGTPNPEMPQMRLRLTFAETPHGSRLTSTSWFNSTEDYRQLLEMGMEEGLTSAMGQMDAVLEDLSSFAAGRGAQTQMLTDTKVRISRIIRGTPEKVWQAHRDPDLMRRWLLGPDGWRMRECQLGEKVGESYRFVWEREEDGSDSFAFFGELKELDAPHREVTTENMEGMPCPPNINEQTLTPVHGGTLLTVVITYPDKETRDIVLGTGMADGMEASYARLEAVLTASSRS
ncbi:SRPBCC domain-containing protein [Nesterenkonia sp. LB17]|uniref:SRPBCC family protein n=1 Tax=Nesterenkonia sp. LB17 TaxID=2901230 RepID=UPI001F4CA719|nr:SRPBCC family protein [Nesterenkonia sp. LB17]MCH8565500.1 SRPBCC domain-containing protein [Nesterenkonia sp. LB17]